MMRNRTADGVLCLILAVGCAAPVVVQKAGEFRWQFPKRKEYIYDYTEETTRTAGATQGKVVTGQIPQTVRRTGTVVVLCDEQMAKVRLTAKAVEQSGSKEIARTVSAEQCILPDGGAVTGLGRPTYRDDLLLPLPRKPLYPGEVLKQEMVYVAPGLPYMEGAGEFTYVGMETASGQRCLHFRVTARLRSEPEKNPDAQQTGEIQADINVLFAVDPGYFVSVEGITRLRLSRAIKGLSKLEQGAASTVEETRRTTLQIKG